MGRLEHGSATQIRLKPLQYALAVGQQVTDLPHYLDSLRCLHIILAIVITNQTKWKI